MVRWVRPLFLKNVLHKVTLYLHMFLLFMLNIQIAILTSWQKSGIGISLHRMLLKLLMFPNDCIIFRKTTKRAVRTIKQILDHYCIVSCQLVNDKSKIQLSKDVLNADKKEISQIIQVPSIDAIGTYLGCMNVDQERKTKQFFDEVKHIYGQKLVGQKSCYLSATGKVVLFKSNLIGIP